MPSGVIEQQHGDPTSISNKSTIQENNINKTYKQDPLDHKGSIKTNMSDSTKEFPSNSTTGTPDVSADVTNNVNTNVTTGNVTKQDATTSDKPRSTINEESDIPTPTSTVDPKEQSVSIEDENDDVVTKQEQSVEPPSGSSPNKRKDNESEETPKPKRSRKLQGAGVKKPLYSRYESLYIVKAFKTISDKHPNLVLIDLFKIVAILFNEEANRQGFKERTPDQLYQKYKRIQHGLNHGETEFLEFFTKNKYNPKEWIPDFSNSETDQILKYIKFPNMDDAINEVLGSSIANLKPPLPDLYDDDDDDEENETKPTIPAPTEDTNTADAVSLGDPEDELLKLAGFDERNSSTTNTNNNNGKSSQLNDLKNKIIQLETQNKVQSKEITILKDGMHAKDQEIIFLKSMIKEDLSYIRHKLNESSTTT